MPGKFTVKLVIQLLLGSDPEKLARERIMPETDLWKVGVLDSFQIVKFISVLEEQLGIVFDYTDLKAKNFRTPGAIHAFLAKKYGLSG